MRIVTRLQQEASSARRRLASRQTDGAVRRPRIARRPILIVAVLLVGTIGLLPIFKWNQFGSADTNFFDQFDLFSQSLVLAKIESTTQQATVAPNLPQAGLMIAGPSAGVVYGAFNGLAAGGAPGADTYLSYISNLGLQGFLFAGAYHAGCTSVGCLETLNSGFTALALLGFAVLLGLITSRSFALTLLVISVFSPWIVAAARNLYWMPSTWFLPAIAAICLVRSRTRRQRFISLVALLACYALRFGMGFEFITTVALLAAAMPVLAFVFRKSPYVSLLGALRASAVIVGVGVAAFLLVVVALAFDVGSGDFRAGLQYVWADAAKRTYGGTSTEPLTSLSLKASVFAVIARYTIGWTTDVIAFGRGTSTEFLLGPQTVWLLIVLAAGVVFFRLWTQDGRGRRDLVLYATALLLPLSWFVLAKSHSAMHTGINFVLWYLLGVSTLTWIIGCAVVDSSALAVRRLLSSAGASARPLLSRELAASHLSRHGVARAEIELPSTFQEAAVSSAPDGSRS